MKLIKSKNQTAFLYLLFGFIFLLFSNGRWVVPAAAFLAPLFIVRFISISKPITGFILLVIAGFISNVFIWKDVMPVSGVFYYIMTFMMSFSTAIVFLIDRLFSKKINGFVATLLLPSAFVLMDFISVSSNPGGTFGAIATTQTSMPLLQLVSITGSWGITFLIYWTASVFNWFMENGCDKYSIKKIFVYYLIPVLVIIVFGQYRLGGNITGSTVKVASINIPKDGIQNISTARPDDVNKNMNERFLKSCSIASASGAKIVFGNETMLNMYLKDVSGFVDKIKNIAQKENIYIGLPMLIYPEPELNMKPENKIIWVSPQGKILFEYSKSRPTPGEGAYGDGVIRYFDSPYGRISSVICFDMDFPGLIKQVKAMDIDIMLVPGNDYENISPYHTFAASFRALEYGFNLVRSVSRGVSACFNYKGQVLSYQDYFTADEELFYSDVPVKGSRTMYSTIGDLLVWLSIACLIYLGMMLIIRK